MLKTPNKILKRQVFKFIPIAALVAFFGLSAFLLPYVVLGEDTQEFLRLLYKSITPTFASIFCITLVLSRRFGENKLRSVPIILVLISLLVLGFLYPRLFGYTQINYGLAYVSYVFITMILAILTHLAFDRIRLLDEKHELEQQNLKSELAVLRNQINPHFLFNTLNNIDSLIKTNTDQASYSLVQLSDIMRYMLYETNVDGVSLEKELNYIENYLKLQELQFANKELVKYSLQGNPKFVPVAPMIFISFIENAFKHCTNKDVPHAIIIAFEIENEIIKFEAINAYDETKQIAKDQSSGAGLENVKRRLELLYPKRHQLEIAQRDNKYIVNLILNNAY